MSVRPTRVISISLKPPRCRKTRNVIVYFRTECYSKCFTSINSCNSPKSPEKLVLLSCYFIDEKIEAWRVTCLNLEISNDRAHILNSYGTNAISALII